MGWDMRLEQIKLFLLGSIMMKEKEVLFQITDDYT